MSTHHKITPENPPQFPCWAKFHTGEWLHFNQPPAPNWIEANLTHWSPDAPTAPTEVPAMLPHPGAQKCQKCGRDMAEHSETAIWECAQSAPTRLEGEGLEVAVRVLLNSVYGRLPADSSDSVSVECIHLRRLFALCNAPKPAPAQPAAAMGEDRALFDWLRETGYCVASDIFCGRTAWACFNAYPAKPETTAHPFPMFDTPQSAIRAAVERHNQVLALKGKPPLALATPTASPDGLDKGEDGEREGHLHGRIGLFAAENFGISDNLPTDDTFALMGKNLAALKEFETDCLWMEEHWHDWQKYIGNDSDGWCYATPSGSLREARFWEAVRAARLMSATRPNDHKGEA